jgi:hypothetical protein
MQTELRCISINFSLLNLIGGILKVHYKPIKVLKARNSFQMHKQINVRKIKINGLDIKICLFSFLNNVCKKHFNKGGVHSF